MQRYFRLQPVGNRGEAFNEIVHLIGNGITHIDGKPVESRVAYNWVWKLSARALIDSFDSLDRLL